MENKLIVYLDMDGVLVEFIGGLHKRMGLPYDTYPYKYGEFEMLEEIAKAKGVGMPELYKQTDDRQFWRDLVWTSYAQDILKLVSEATVPENTFILTSPMARGDAWAGKVDWVLSMMPEFKRRLIICAAPKHLLAKPNTLLIDDKDQNVDDFIAHGGAAFLVPRPWNSAHADHPHFWKERLKTMLNRKML